MVKLSASGLLQGLAESFGYFPIDLGASGHPPLCLAPARLWVGLVEALGEPVRENLFGGSVHWVFPSAESNGSGANTPRSTKPSRLAFPAATRSEGPRWAKDPGRGAPRWSKPSRRRRCPPQGVPFEREVAPSRRGPGSSVVTLVGLPMALLLLVAL